VCDRCGMVLSVDSIEQVMRPKNLRNRASQGRGMKIVKGAVRARGNAQFLQPLVTWEHVTPTKIKFPRRTSARTQRREPRRIVKNVGDANRRQFWPKRISSCANKQTNRGSPLPRKISSHLTCGVDSGALRSLLCS
jgi:hypothetical protein